MQILVLLPKAGKTLGDPSAYIPLCLLDMAGKVLKRIILNRLLRYTKDVDGLLSNQLGLQNRRSTAEAILSITKIAEIAL